jgi:hypothetical protein
LSKKVGKQLKLYRAKAGACPEYSGSLRPRVPR